MQWNIDTLKRDRTSAKLLQPALAEALEVHFRLFKTGKRSYVYPNVCFSALDKLFRETSNLNVLSREEYDKVVKPSNSSTELNRKLTDIIQSKAYMAD